MTVKSISHDQIQSQVCSPKPRHRAETQILLAGHRSGTSFLLQVAIKDNPWLVIPAQEIDLHSIEEEGFFFFLAYKES